ncbi:TIR domain-containing protein [Enterobacter bugandensis]|uniref:TIR domain-containing protein n=1 Tax=Enterobacter bugandensis TaxID=881260 RepID=UPI0037543E08
MKRKVFYSFHFDNDVMRVQQIRNMGLLEGDEPVNPNTWEKIKRTEQGVKNWINENLAGKSCLVVLIGSQTASRPWVKYEIQKAWEEGKAVVGVYIHRLKCPRNGFGIKGANPFDQFTFKRGDQVIKPHVYEPSFDDAYNDIKNNLATWIENAIKQ